ncbi:hypothetical protein [Streptomyces kebangsaanensis]|uniref:hypothetical protein n=1 Tax=Streptomyces kebangsaanensis TaxID=864058 RepID=UPI00093D1365|nr:hypothetical protein [Streptomyces kebangsaanensis]
MTTAPDTTMPLPPYPGLNILETVERHDVDGAQVRSALRRVNNALDIAWGAECGLTKGQFTQLVCHCFYNRLLDQALRRPSTYAVAFLIEELVGELSA